MILYDLPAPAKLNLFLHVVGRRSDGYHLLQTAFRFIDLCDTLSFERRSDGQVVCETRIDGLSPDDDLVVRAARLLQRTTGTRYGVQISYKKLIPTGGGLGGGSSNAATTLIALNRLWQTGLSRTELLRMGLLLGADVPVFVFGQNAFAEGVGDELCPIQVPNATFLVVEPVQKVATSVIFSDPDLTRNTRCIKISFFADWLKAQAAKNNAQKNSVEYFGSNDLQPVVFARYPVVSQAYTYLDDHGIDARMTGSGACLFAQYATPKQARLHQQEIVGKISCRTNDQDAVVRNVWVCPGLPAHPLRHWLHH